MYHLKFILLIGLTIFSCQNAKQKYLEAGPYRGLINVANDKALAFNFMVTDSTHLEVYNANEVIYVDEVSYKEDSVIIKLPVFEGYLKAAITDKGLNGYFRIDGLNRSVPFKAINGISKRYDISEEANVNLSGSWEITFNKAKASGGSKGLAIFQQNQNKVTGTIRTTTGDHRYLEGVLDGNMLKLSAFDGAHAFYYEAKVKGDQFEGIFYSGNHYTATINGKMNPDFRLASGDTLTYLKPGYDKLYFAFPDANGKTVSLDDEKFKDKVTVVQLMGSWCPNCLDETRFFKSYIEQHKNLPLEFVGLAFEYSKSEDQAYERIKRLQDRLEIDYPILLAQFGSTSKTSAQEKLPMLNAVLSYPTSIIVDKKGKVRYIHSGFDGPATGKPYEIYTRKFDSIINNLAVE